MVDFRFLQSYGGKRRRFRCAFVSFPNIFSLYQLLYALVSTGLIF